MPGQADNAVVLRDVMVRHGRRVALEAISGCFAPGSLTAVIGANGAGKSTLLAAIAGTVRLTRGTLERPPSERLAWLPQQTAIDRDYPLTVSELILLGGWGEFGAFRAPSPAMRDRMAAAARSVGLTEHGRRRIGELSVGQLQRALFARLILRDADVILLDEPFAAVDTQTLDILLRQVALWHEEGRTVIAVLHDLDLVRTWFPSTLHLARRCLGWGTTAGVLAAAPA